MTDNLSSGYTNLPLAEIIKTSKSGLTIGWFGKLMSDSELYKLCNILNIQARKQNITTNDAWEKFALCYLTIHYHDKNGNDADWSDTGAQHYTIKGWSSKKSVTRNQEFSNKILISIYDTVKDKGILVDGNKRAAILTRENQSQSKPNLDVLIYEWYGDLVNMIFPTDLCQHYQTGSNSGAINAKIKGKV